MKHSGFLVLEFGGLVPSSFPASRRGVLSRCLPRCDEAPTNALVPDYSFACCYFKGHVSMLLRIAYLSKSTLYPLKIVLRQKRIF